MLYLPPSRGANYSVAAFVGNGSNTATRGLTMRQVYVPLCPPGDAGKKNNTLLRSLSFILILSRADISRACRRTLRGNPDISQKYFKFTSPRKGKKMRSRSRKVPNIQRHIPTGPRAVTDVEYKLIYIIRAHVWGERQCSTVPTRTPLDMIFAVGENPRRCAAKPCVRQGIEYQA